MSALSHDPFLINTVGHAVGTLLFGVMAALLIQDWRHNGVRQTRLSLVAAGLALLWNLGSLLVLAISGKEPATLNVTVNLCFSVLSVLPAVLLRIVLRRSQPLFRICAYALSACAVLLQCAALFVPSRALHEAGLLVIAIGFAALISALLAVRLHSLRPSFLLDSQSPSLVCLLLFTLSFLHFGHGHAASNWTAEIAWHHAGIPLVLFVLLQDYRFLLLDVFRFLLNFGLAAVYGISGLLLYERMRHMLFLPQNRFWLAISSVAVCLALISFALARTRLQQWLFARVFARRSLTDCVAKLADVSAAAASEEQLLTGCGNVIAGWFGAARVSVLRQHTGSPSPDGDLAWIETAVPLHFSRGDSASLALGARQGGRRYLSEDLQALQSLGMVAAAQVERFRSQQLHRFVREAELRALQSQINPHFLFNALNTLYGTIDRQSQPARRFVLNLADIFRYFLHTDQTFIPLEEELHIVRAYLEIEELRLGDRLHASLAVPPEAMGILIPKLSVQPLVENAVKHGVAARQGRGTVALSVLQTTAGTRIEVTDSGPGFHARNAESSPGTGVGLENVRQRLHLCYGDAGHLQIQTGSSGTVVALTVPAESSSSLRNSGSSHGSPGSSFRNFEVLAKTATAAS